MYCLAEFRLHDVAAGDDRAVMVVPRKKDYALRCVNYKSPFVEDALRQDWSRYTYTLCDGVLSSVWHAFMHEVDYLGRLYGMQ